MTQELRKRPSNSLSDHIPLPFFWTALCAALILLPSSLWGQCQTDPNQTEVGRCWETTLVATQNYTNPYRDVELTVHFEQPSGAGQFTVKGFWDGGQNFKVRTVFPDTGGWTWAAFCTGGGCASDPGLNRGGDVRVVSSTSTNPLYQGGFLEVAEGRFLRNQAGTPFFWLGDTSWVGPLQADPTEWDLYLADRKAKDFSLIQVALPADWMDTRGVQPKDPTGRRPFSLIAGCSSPDPLPNACSRWNPNFWRAFENKIQAANDEGFMVVLVGLMERLIEGNGGAPYPTITDSKIYARNIASRLAGHYVIFSPSFDTRPGIDPALCTPSSTDISCRMRFVGREIRDAAPLHLITNHWGGREDRFYSPGPNLSSFLWSKLTVLI